MKFSEIVKQAVLLLHESQRITYRALKREFSLDDDALEDLKSELIDAQRVARDEDGKVLVWIGTAPGQSAESNVQSSSLRPHTADAPLHTPHAERSAAERRQLTVMFCDLVGSTVLSTQLDPEDLRAVVQQYQQTCAEAIQRHEGYIAQYLGDGLLVYFGYPVAHEDDARRAVRAGVEIIAALRERSGREQQAAPLQVRIGIHTGVVVVGEMGGGNRQEQLALGETPNLAARLQGLAEPDTIVMSAVTQQLVTGFFTCRDLGPQTLKGIATPVPVYQVLGESGLQSRFAVAVQTGLTPLVGRDEELALLRGRWEQATDGAGQAVLLSGEAGIGKSRLVEEFKNAVAQHGAVRREFRCSPYHQNSAFYPLIEHLQQLLDFAPSDTPQAKRQKLEQTLARYRFPHDDTVPLLAALLSLPHPEESAPLTLTPPQQKQQTLDALVHWLFEDAERAPIYLVWEDLHWADPSTLEFLALCLDQVPTARLLMLLTFRPEFTPPWASRSHVSHLVLSRLGRTQTSAIVEQITGGKALPADVLQQIIAKTDGVPLFVEELTKSVVESVGATGRSPLQLGIPATLHDALMARLDRLGTAKEVAQQAAVVGREVTYEILHAVSPLSEVALQQELSKLTAAELLYQRGRPPQATYLFKHALVQETAYHSLLKSKRQQYHHQIAQIFEERFRDIAETQPELVAHHYTEAGLIAQAIPYWQQAGQRAIQRSAHPEAVTHLSIGVALLKTLPNTPEHIERELMMQVSVGSSLIITKGFADPDVEKAYRRAQELCRQVGETPQLFPVLRGLIVFYLVRGDVQTAYTLKKHFFSLAQHVQDPAHLTEAHYLIGGAMFTFGQFTTAREHYEHGTAFYDPQQHRTLALVYGHDPQMANLSFLAHTLWLLGYPEQALKSMHQSLTWVQELSSPYNQAGAFAHAAQLHLNRHEGQAAYERATASLALATEQGFALLVAQGHIWKGAALAEQGQGTDAVHLIRQGLDACAALQSVIWRSYHLALLAEAYGKIGQPATGLSVIAEALALVDNTGDRSHEAELFRLKGELTLQQESKELRAASTEQKSEEPDPKAQIRDPQGEAEACFLKAIAIAQQQQAKSLELRAATSLARLWQQQGKRTEAHKLLSEVYTWFTEGFDTKDLQEAKTLIAELA